MRVEASPPDPAHRPCRRALRLRERRRVVDHGASATAAPAAGGPDKGAFPVTIDPQVRLDDDRVGAQARRRRRPARAGRAARARRRSRRHDRVVRRASRRDLPVGQGRARRARKVPTVLTNTDGIEIEKIAAQRPGPDPRRLLRHDQEGVRRRSPSSPRSSPSPRARSTTARPGRRRRTITGKAVGRAAKAHELVERDREADRRRRRRASGVQGQDRGQRRRLPGHLRLRAAGRPHPHARRRSASPTRRSCATRSPNEFGGQLSDEKVDALDVGASIWFADGDRSVDELKKRPASTASSTSARRAATSSSASKDRVYEATSFPSVLSMPTLMKELVPRLAAAADGDPATSTDQQPEG